MNRVEAKPGPLRELKRLIADGESETLELKRSTGQLRRAAETLCAFLNTRGGKVVLGVAEDGRLVGQEVSEKTLREVAAMLDRFEPPASVDVEVVELPGRDKHLLVLEARPQDDSRPFLFDGRPSPCSTTGSRSVAWAACHAGSPRSPFPRATSRCCATR